MLKRLDDLDKSSFATSSQWSALKAKAVQRILLDREEICYGIEIGQVQEMDMLLNLLGNTCLSGLLNSDKLVESKTRLTDSQEGVRLYREILKRSVGYGFMTEHDAVDSIRMLLEAIER